LFTECSRKKFRSIRAVKVYYTCHPDLARKFFFFIAGNIRFAADAAMTEHGPPEQEKPIFNYQVKKLDCPDKLGNDNF
jgi:hypothetical protein